MRTYSGIDLDERIINFLDKKLDKYPELSPTLQHKKEMRSKGFLDEYLQLYSSLFIKKSRI